MEPTRETHEAAEAAESGVKEHTTEVAHKTAEKGKELIREASGEAQEAAEGLIESLADQLESFAGDLRSQKLDSILDRIGTTARENPGLFLAGSIAAGLAASWLAKSAADRRSHGGHGQTTTQTTSRRSDGHTDPTR